MGGGEKKENPILIEAVLRAGGEYDKSKKEARGRKLADVAQGKEKKSAPMRGRNWISFKKLRMRLRKRRQGFGEKNEGSPRGRDSEQKHQRVRGKKLDNIVRARKKAGI